jgi:3-phenylpropionate/trans-cinnamate dioxygenase ferredoxin reductase subunit
MEWMAKAKDPILIIGGGRAAASFVDAYREAGGEALITILSADDSPPYNRPPLSKGVLRGEMEPDGALVHEAEEYDDLVVELRLETAVESIDPGAHTVQLAGGDSLPYGTLVIASGAHPRQLSIPGGDLPAVKTFRTLADAVALAEEGPEARKILVVGGSFIGSEIAASLRMRGLEVTLVEQGDHLMPALASEELSDQVAELYREHGVELLLGEEIQEFRANGRSLTGAVTASGQEIEAFRVVVGVGVEPETGFLERSGLELDNGVVVDDHFRAGEDIYAIGDVARFDDTVAGRQRRIEHWSNADNQGRYLGQALAADGRTAYSEVSVFFTKLFDLQLQVLGDPGAGVDEVVIRGSIADRNVLAFHLRDDRLVGAVVVGQGEDLVEELKVLLREQPEIGDRSRLGNEHIRPKAVFAA